MCVCVCVCVCSCVRARAYVCACMCLPVSQCVCLIVTAVVGGALIKTKSGLQAEAPRGRSGGLRQVENRDPMPGFSAPKTNRMEPGARSHTHHPRPSGSQPA